MKTVYIVDNYMDEPHSYHEFDSDLEALEYVNKTLEAFSGKWVKQPAHIDLPFYDNYIDPINRLYLFSTSWVQRPTVYDITDEDIRGRAPDMLNVADLQPTDIVGRWVNVTICPTVSTPQPDGIGLREPKTTLLEGEEVLMCYVAVIQPDNRFKVYADWGERTNIGLCAQDGRKVCDGGTAYFIFPMLKDYEFVSK